MHIYLASNAIAARAAIVVADYAIYSCSMSHILGIQGIHEGQDNAKGAGTVREPCDKSLPHLGIASLTQREVRHIGVNDVVEGERARLQRHALGLPGAALRHLLEERLRQHMRVNGQIGQDKRQKVLLVSRSILQGSADTDLG